MFQNYKKPKKNLERSHLFVPNSSFIPFPKGLKGCGPHDSPKILGDSRIPFWLPGIRITTSRFMGGSIRGPWRVVSQVYPPNVCAKYLSRRPTNVPILEASTTLEANEISHPKKSVVFSKENHITSSVYICTKSEKNPCHIHKHSLRV